MKKDSKVQIIKRILAKARKNPKYKKRLMEDVNKPQYQNEAHRKNSEAAMKQLEEWAKLPLSLEDALKRQRAREKRSH